MGKRRYKPGLQREQGYLLPPRLEDYVTEDNPVRAIDSYVACLDLGALHFQHASGAQTAGQPAYPPGSLLKLYLYGYLHRLRSSRQLEAECRRNLEVIWLLQGLQPSYKTIADFRKDNLQALQQVNQDFVQVCKELDLFGAELVGIDGSFFRGNVARAHVFTAQQLQHAVEHIQDSIQRYLAELDQMDQVETPPTGQVQDLHAKLAHLRQRQAQRSQQAQQLQASGQTQIAEVDPDARLLRKGGQCIAGYNVQTAVDAKHKLIVAGAVTQDGNDSQQAAPMGLAAQQALGVAQLVTVQDQGYFNGHQIQTCLAHGITPYMPEPAKTNEKAQPERLLRRDFTYDESRDSYTCPHGTGLAHSADRLLDGRRYAIYQAAPQACAECPHKAACLPPKTRYRTVTRSDQEAIFVAHRARMAQKGAALMRQRAQLCEHPFGTLKLWCGGRHFYLRGLAKVRAEWALLMWSYNFKRVLAIVGLAFFRSYCALRPRLAAAVES